jgi:transposase
MIIMKSILSKVRADLKRINDPVIHERLLIVQASCRANLREVAQTFGCTHGKVAYWKNRYTVEGIRGLYTKERSGRPSKLQPEQAAKIRRKIRHHNIKQGWTTKHIRETIQQESGVTYSKRQSIRIAQSWGLSKIKPRPRYAYSKKGICLASSKFLLVY